MQRRDCRRMRGTVYDNHGYWYYDVRLPGEERRRKRPLCAPGSGTAMKSDRPKEMAFEAARRIWEEATRRNRAAPTTGISVDDLCGRFLAYAEVYYRGGSESANCTIALRPLREMFGRRPVAELVHADLLAVRDAHVRRGLARETVNRYMRIVTHRLVPWALDESLIRAGTAAELSQVRPLKRNRSAARETEPVRPVADSVVEATLPLLMPNTADMVRVHRLTGMRPGELCAMRWRDIDESGVPWVYRPEHHKNEWRSQPRVVLIGPRAREILGRHRGGERPFSPVAAVAERMAAKRAARTSPFYPCRDERYTRAKENAAHRPGEAWTTQSYGRAVKEACIRGGIEPWGVNRLRHTFGTAVRRGFGLDAARAALGHADGSRVTDRYSFEAAEDEQIARARAAVEALG